MTKHTFIIPSFNDDMGNRLTALYNNGGQYAVYDYVNKNHPDWRWAFCAPCDCNSPVWLHKRYALCAVCFSVINEGNVVIN